MDTDKVMVHFSTTITNKSRVKKLAKMTGHSASFFYNLMIERCINEVEASFLAGKGIKDEHLDHLLGE